jgi:hypothetical protein
VIPTPFFITVRAIANRRPRGATEYAMDVPIQVPWSSMTPAFRRKSHGDLPMFQRRNRLRLDERTAADDALVPRWQLVGLVVPLHIFPVGVDEISVVPTRNAVRVVAIEVTGSLE